MADYTGYDLSKYNTNPYYNPYMPGPDWGSGAIGMYANLEKQKQQKQLEQQLAQKYSLEQQQQATAEMKARSEAGEAGARSGLYDAQAQALREKPIPEQFEADEDSLKTAAQFYGYNPEKVLTWSAPAKNRLITAHTAAKNAEFVARINAAARLSQANSKATNLRLNMLGKQLDAQIADVNKTLRMYDDPMKAMYLKEVQGGEQKVAATRAWSQKLQGYRATLSSLAAHVSNNLDDPEAIAQVDDIVRQMHQDLQAGPQAPDSGLMEQLQQSGLVGMGPTGPATSGLGQPAPSTGVSSQFGPEATAPAPSPRPAGRPAAASDKYKVGEVRVATTGKLKGKKIRYEGNDIWSEVK